MQKILLKYNHISGAIVFLIVILSITHNTIYDNFSIYAEIILLLILSLGCYRFKYYNKTEVFLIYVFIFSQIVSYIMNDITVFLLNFKLYAIPILTIIYFSRIKYLSKLIPFIFTLTILLLFVSLIDNTRLYFLIEIASMKQFNLGRFGGVFLNAHFNATFIAIFLYYIGRRYLWRRLAGLYIMLKTGSRFVFVAYLASIILVSVKNIIPINNKIIKYILIFLFLILLWMINIYKLNINNFLYDQRLASAMVMFWQLNDWQMWEKFIFQLYPNDYSVIVDSYYTFVPKVERIVDGRFSYYKNEIGLFSMFVTGGITLASIYLYHISVKSKYLIVLILITLMHVTYILSPLIVYMLITYSREIENRVN